MVDDLTDEMKKTIRINELTKEYGKIQKRNKKVVDENGNELMTIPEGFGFVDPNKDKTIKYTDNTKPDINDGIVISDEFNENKESIGNEFVWIPVKDINTMYDETNKAGKLYNFAPRTKCI